MAARHRSDGRTRLVVVGETGLTLRFDDGDGLDVMRVRGPLDAIAAISASAGAPGSSTIVFIAQGALSSDAASEIDAMRTVDSEISVVCVGLHTPMIMDRCDALLSASATDADTIGLIRELTGAAPEVAVRRTAGPQDPSMSDRRAPEIATTVAPSDIPLPRPAARSGTPSVAPKHAGENGASTAPIVELVGDRELVSDVIAGRDIMPRALRMIRQRLGRSDVHYIPAGEREDRDGPAEPVQIGETVVGHLTFSAEASTPESHAGHEEADAAAIHGHAAWLGAWLKLSKQSQSLRRAAMTDPLTGAWNRRYSERFLSNAIERSRTERHVLTVLYFDIDGFKQYNDTFGHAAGDEILVEVVKALQAVIRPSDRVCRVGGDEFVVIFFEPSGPRRSDSRPPESVYVLTKRVQQKIREREFPKLGREAAGRLTISGGLATYPWDGADADSLLQRADELAMQSKRQGKNAITLGPGAERICDVRVAEIETATLSDQAMCDDERARRPGDPQGRRNAEPWSDLDR